jgi:outer membrane protein assembly factor BamB
MDVKHRLFTAIAVVVAAAATATIATGQDWPQWRGPKRDGVAAFSAPASWPDQLTEQWKVEVGQGYATPLLVGDRLYLYTRQKEDEVMSALDAQTGKVIWRTSYSAPFQMNPATARHGPGPKSTPTFANGRLFTMGMTGVVSAFDAASGKRLWQKAASPVQPLYHTATSPIVEGNLVIVHTGGHDDGALSAFDVATGDAKWSWNGDGPAYGSPMVFDFGGTRQVVTFTQKNLVGVSVSTGQLLWQRPFVTQSTTTSQTPVLHKDMVIQPGRGNGFTAFRVVRNGNMWSTQDVWHTDEVSLHMTNGVVAEGVLYGLSHLNSGEYFALDLDTGKVLWKSEPRQAENAAIVRAGDTIFSLEQDGELVVLRHNRVKFEPVKRYKLATTETWTQPTISGNRLFVKDVAMLTLWTVK